MAMSHPTTSVAGQDRPAPRHAWPRVSIITPSFNQARFLRRCIDSVLEQDYPNLQYLILDGGSRDGTLDILRAYGGAITWRSGPDGGQAAAINEGLSRADGEIVAWLNSDDFYLPGAIERAVAFFEAHPDADLVYGRAWMVDEAGLPMREYPTFRFSHHDLARKCYVCQPAVFLRRRTIEAVGLLNERLDVCLDYEWWLRITRDRRCLFCNERLASSRHYETTKTASRRSRALIEAGYLMRHHFGRAPWRWSAKWIAHRMRLHPSRFAVPLVGWTAALISAVRYHRRFDARQSPSRFGKRLLSSFS